MKAKVDFWSLPLELQLHILSYTDLVTPNSRVYWDPTEGFHLSEDVVENPGIGTQRECQMKYFETDCEPPYDTCIRSRHKSCSSLLQPVHYKHEWIPMSSPDPLPSFSDTADFCTCPHGSTLR